MKGLIQERLAQLERQRNICILYACESGSRAWGFASQDSDYDVRFIYAHPTAWYLSLDNHPDTIELPIEDAIDFAGWDIRKALNLFRKSNPPLLEWLQSPIQYREQFGFAEHLRKMLPRYYSPRACLRHYFHMAHGNFTKYLSGETVGRKRYFYVLRPVLACQWIERQLGPVPMEFNTLYERIVQDDDLKAAISNLLKEKAAGTELGKGPPIANIHRFLESELARLAEEHAVVEAEIIDIEQLNELFRCTLQQVDLWMATSQ